MHDHLTISERWVIFDTLAIKKSKTCETLFTQKTISFDHILNMKIKKIQLAFQKFTKIQIPFLEIVTNSLKIEVEEKYLTKNK